MRRRARAGQAGTAVGVVLMALLLMVGITTPVASASPAAGGVTAAAAERGPDAARNRAANRTLIAVNNKRYRVAKRFATPRAVRKLRSFRERGYTFYGRARNGCYEGSEPGVWDCPGTHRKDRRLTGGLYMQVARSGPDSRWRVVEAVVALGE